MWPLTCFAVQRLQIFHFPNASCIWSEPEPSQKWWKAISATILWLALSNDIVASSLSNDIVACSLSNDIVVCSLSNDIVAPFLSNGIVAKGRLTSKAKFFTRTWRRVSALSKFVSILFPTRKQRIAWGEQRYFFAWGEVRLNWTSFLDLCDRKILGVAKISFSCSQR